MKIVFLGTDLFAAKILSYLLQNNFEVVAVVTKPDKPQGRGVKMAPSPVKEFYLQGKRKIPLYQPVKASVTEFEEELKKLKADLFLVVSYGEILKQHFLDIPKIGVINVHPSLLPKYRGPSPIQSAVLAGEKEIGVSIMKMELALDAGGIIRVKKMPLPINMTFGEAEEMVGDLSKEVLVEVLRDIEKTRKISYTPQDEKEATFTKKIIPEESFIDWNRDSNEVNNFIRGMNPHPGARVYVEVGGIKKLLKIFRITPVEREGLPGDILCLNPKQGFIIGCKWGAISVLELQLEGKKKVSIKEFLNGIHDLKLV